MIFNSDARFGKKRFVEIAARRIPCKIVPRSKAVANIEKPIAARSINLQLRSEQDRRLYSQPLRAVANDIEIEFHEPLRARFQNRGKLRKVQIEEWRASVIGA